MELPSIYPTVKTLSGFIWLNAQKNTDGLFYYNNDAYTTVNTEALYIDETSKYLNGDCVAILPIKNNTSKFYLHAVNCTISAQAVCKANVTIAPPPEENLPELPCIDTVSRRKRDATLNECDDSNKEKCGKLTTHKGICITSYKI